MKKFLIFLVSLFLLFGNFVFAGKPDKKNSHFDKCCDMKISCKIEKMSCILNLTDDQKIKLEKILKDFDTEKDIKKDKFGKEMLKLKNDKDNKIKEILNSDQKIQFIVLNTLEKVKRQECFEDFMYKGD